MGLRIDVRSGGYLVFEVCPPIDDGLQVALHDGEIVQSISDLFVGLRVEVRRADLFLLAGDLALQPINLIGQ